MLLLIAINLFSLWESGYGESYGKCCKNGEILQEIGDSYKCVPDYVKRHGVLVPRVDVLENSTGECVEFSTDFYQFEISGKIIIKKEPIKDEIFPKCCPVGYIYNEKKHSCDKKNTYEHNFIKTTLIAVGLPRCRSILDTKMDSIENFETEGDYCIDETSTGFIRRECKNNTDFCNYIKCIKKCCPDGKSYVNSNKCSDSYVNGIDLEFSEKIDQPNEPFGIIHNTTLCDGKFYLMNESRYIFNLEKNGEFKYWKNTTNSFVIEKPTDTTGYCIEHAHRHNMNGYFFFNCIPNTPPKPKFRYTKWPKILSCIFLSLTIIIYVLLKQTKKLFGKILINYCVGTLCLYALLTYTQFDLQPKDISCHIVGYMLIFFASVSYTWLNVMCWDIWFTFGTTKHSIGTYRQRNDMKKLLGYMVYGWGAPLILTLVVFGFSVTDVLPTSFKPYVGTTACFLVAMQGNYALLIFLRLPHLVIQLVNTFLFIRTILYCLRIKNEIERINDTKNEKKAKFNKDKEKLYLILKLAVIMGITFIMDTVTGFVDMNNLGTFWMTVEIVIDSINCLQGVYIFVIFICKKSIYHDFMKKLYVIKRETYLNNTDSFVSTTHISLKQNKNDEYK
ncbi:probable G-protein coupled receptor Mth-like 6 isoform X1 [Diorhabda sublineata]|uniref:probable G-protein coupled receptor Mth-like 6 isoform X1 n=1 Tax=Diorhabda sublineata TaxID=1163346 RepID=UPI0024E16797|nr:probable G-protein coupled receptor Mth-like 6 isoform X1 [Diorhabda sublineata]